MSSASAVSTRAQEADRDLRAIASGAGLSLLGRVVNGSVLFVYGIAVARLLDLRDVGVLMLGLTIIRVCEIVARVGLEFGTLHNVSILKGTDRSSSVRGTVRNAVVFVVAFSIVLAGGLLAGAPALARLFDAPELVPVMRILAVSVPLTSATMVLLGALLGLQQFAHNTIAEKLVLPVSHLAICVLLLVAGFGMEGASVAYVFAAMLTLPLTWHFFRLSTPGGAAGEPVATAELLRFSVPFVPVVIFTQVLVWIDTLALGVLRDAHEVGIYSAAMRTALVASLIIGAFNAIFAPTISNLYHRKDFDHLEFLFKTVGKWMFMAALPLVLLILLLSEELMLLFGPEFADGSTALAILALAQLAGASAGTAGFMLTMSGRYKLMLLNTACACAVSIALSVLLIPRFGMNGAATAGCLSFGVFQVLSAVQVRWTMGMHPYNGGYVKALVAAAVPFAVLAFVKTRMGEPGFVHEIAGYSIVFGVTYVVLLYVLGFAKEDKVVLSALKRKLLRRA